MKTLLYLLSLFYAALINAQDFDSPAIFIKDKQIVDSADGMWNTGDTVDLMFTLKNWGINASNVQGTISIVSGRDYVNIINGNADFGTIAKKGIGNNSNSRFKITAFNNAPSPYTANFQLHITADGGYSKDIDFALDIELPPDFLLPPSITSVYGLAFDGLYLWTTDDSSASIYKLSQQGYIMSGIPAPGGQGCTGLAWDTNSTLWVQNKNTKMIYRVNPVTGNIMANFPSPATQCPAGLAFDGTDLWVSDKDAYKIYKVNTSGNVLASFTIPVIPQTCGGPIELAFDPRGPDNGSLVVSMVHCHKAEQGISIFDSVTIWEITRNGSLVSKHHFRTPDVNGKAIEVNPVTGKYWVNSFVPGKIYRVKGFYEVALDEAPFTKDMEFVNITLNSTEHKVCFNFFVSSESKVDIGVYDTTGKKIYNINKAFKPGEYALSWSCKKVSPGNYLCSIKSGSLMQTKKIIIPK
ncbi:MAG: T9SS type A sorting domain-containing protein [bacterium]|nr:T9SS type A sorting domain-containing protein [bacterium]